jgi:hypothetical protein
MTEEATGSAAEEIAQFIVLSSEPVCRVMLLEAAPTSDPSFDPAMALFQSIIQIVARPVADVAVPAASGLRAGGSYAHRLSRDPGTKPATDRTERKKLWAALMPRVALRIMSIRFPLRTPDTNNTNGPVP